MARQQQACLFRPDSLPAVAGNSQQTLDRIRNHPRKGERTPGKLPGSGTHEIGDLRTGADGIQDPARDRCGRELLPQHFFHEISPREEPRHHHGLPGLQPVKYLLK